ncbi:MAG: acyl-CoA dehydrogenase family protein [Candidatus Spechtbacteria bacterium]|nr:acyl-CoA dehydrogenase family protein [Candidatus Spechtbacteria bacterium]
MQNNAEFLQMLREAVHEFVTREVVPYGYKVGEPLGEFPAAHLKKLFDLGVGSLVIPEKYGGGGASTEATSIVARELAYGWPSLHLVWSANNSLAAYPLVEFGTDQQKQKYLPYLARGEMFGCFALTETNAGSDAASLQTKAVWKPQRKGSSKGVWVLNGSKIFITNPLNASIAIVFARVVGDYNPRRRHSGITAFILDSNGPGLKKKGVQISKIEKWGFCAAPFCEIFFSDVEISEYDVLGKIGQGFNIAMETLGNGRINIAAQSVGIARRALDEAVSYAKARQQFDRALFDNQSVAHELARLHAQIDAAWELTLCASRLKDAGKPYAQKSSEAKWFASEIALQAALYAYRIYGGNGYAADSVVMRILHDALATVTYEGASNIQLEVISKNL